MGKTKDLGHLAHIVAYDSGNHITVPAGITMHTNQLVASQAWVTTALGSYTLSSSLSSYVPTSRTITINGTTFDLSANRNWDITSMIYPAAGIALSTGSAWGTSITNNSANWNTAYGWGNHASAGYLTGITSLLVTNALGFTPYNATNPAGYITGISFANVSAKPTTLAGYGITDAVPSSRTITINGTVLDLSANRSWTITATETDTLATVTARGATTSDIVTFTSTTSAASVIARNDGNGTSWRGRIGHFNATADKSVWFATYNGFAVVGAHNNALTAWADLLVNCVNNNGDGGTTRLSTSSFVGSNAIIHAGNIGSQSVSNATTAGGLSVHAGRNNEANKIVRTDGNGYIQAGYINSTSGNENNNSNADRVWGTNGSDDYLRTYRTSALSVGYAASSGNSSTTSQRDFNYLRINSNNHLYLDYNYGQSIIGVYSASRYQGVFSMGAAYVLPLDGTTPGNLYGMAWSHPNAGGVAGNLNTHGLLVMENGTFLAAISGSIRARDDMRAPIFYDSNDTGYYLDPNSESSLYRFTSTTMTRNAMNYLSINSPFTTRAAQAGPYQNGTMGWGTVDFNTVFSNWGSGFIDTWSSPGNAPGGSSHYVGIQSCHYNHQNSANVYGFQMACAGEADNRFFWRSAWPGIRGWVEMIHTGNIGSQTVSTAGNLSVNATANNIYNSGWFRNYGDSGLYNQDYGCHIARNSQSSHGSWSMWGYTKAGYVGMNLQDPQTYNNNLMYENGNGGMYTENANGWQWYYNRGSNCLGLGGSTTYNWVRAVVNGKLKIESDSIHTGWAYFDSNLQLAGGGNTLYNEYNLWYVWRNWGGWGGEWINRNGGDMIMNLYAVYSVTGSISDIRYKKDVTALSYGLNEIMQLNPIKYHYNLPKESMLANDPDYFLGFSAQEVQALIPEAVHEKMGSDNKDGMLAITYDELIPVLVNGMKEQQVMIHNQNIKINKLEALVNQLLNN